MSPLEKMKDCQRRLTESWVLLMANDKLCNRIMNLAIKTQEQRELKEIYAIAGIDHEPLSHEERVTMDAVVNLVAAEIQMRKFKEMYG